MAVIKLGDLTTFTGDASGSWLVMNDPTNTTTYKVERETLLSGYVNDTASFATLGSNQFNGNQSINGDVTASNALFTGNITAQTLVVQTITSSVEYVTGSTKFGSLSTDTHQFTGSVNVTSSLIVNGNVGINTSSPRAPLEVVGNIIAKSGSNLVIYNPETGWSGAMTVNDGYHTVLNGKAAGIDGGTGQIAIGGTVTANTNGSNFNIALGYSTSCTTNPLRSIAIGYQAIANGTDTVALGYGANAPAGTFVLNAGGAERMRIDSSGNLMIGHPTSSYKFQVSGSGVSGSLNVNNTLYVSGSNVGIGTTTPQYKLEVSGGFKATDASIISSSLTFVSPGNTPGYISPNTDGISLGNNNSGVHIRIRNSNRTALDQSVAFGSPGFGWSTNEKITIQTQNATNGSSAIWVGNGVTNNNIFKVYGDGTVSIGPTISTGYALQVSSTASGSLNVDNKLIISGSSIQMTGSVSITGSVNIDGNITTTGNSNTIGSTTTSTTLTLRGSNVVSFVISDVLNSRSFQLYKNAGSGYIIENNSANKLSYGYAGNYWMSWHGSLKAIALSSTTSEPTPDNSSILDLQSTTKGLLSPRMTAAQRTAISAPAQGLQVYDTGSVTEGIWYYNSGSLKSWTRVLNDSGSQVLSGSLTVSGSTTIQGLLVQTVTTNRQTNSYTLALSDNGKLVETNVGTANNVTVPVNSSIPFPVGAKVDVVQYGAGQTTIVADVGVTIRSANSWLKINAQYGAVSLIKIGTDEWYAIGNLSA